MPYDSIYYIDRNLRLVRASLSTRPPSPRNPTIPKASLSHASSFSRILPWLKTLPPFLFVLVPFPRFIPLFLHELGFHSLPRAFAHSPNITVRHPRLQLHALQVSLTPPCLSPTEKNKQKNTRALPHTNTPYVDHLTSATLVATNNHRCHQPPFRLLFSNIKPAGGGGRG